MPRYALALALLLPAVHAQTSVPLESVSIEGTALAKDFVLEIGGLHIGAAIDKAGIEAACARLRDSGLFASIAYRYAPGPRKGYALTLTVSDQGGLVEAAIDIPGVDEKETWDWLATQYPAYRRRVPGNDAAQQFVARKIEDHIGPALDGQHLVMRMETDLGRHTSLVSFQPENLPRVASMSFTGAHALTGDQLTALLAKVVAGQGYTERHFREAVELNLRPAYEKLGMYRVRFPSITSQKTGAGALAVATAVEEGPQYKLGDVEFVGDHLPLDAMHKADAFKKGAVANWDEIQHGIWDAERPIRRAGYMNASTSSERVFHDDRLVLDVKVPVRLGPLFRFGKLTLTGLTPAQEDQARRKWKLQPGDPFDFMYAGEFLAEFVRTIPGAPFKKYNVKTSPGAAQYVTDYELIFESR